MDYLKNNLLIAILLLSIMVGAQPNTEFEKYKNRYPNAHAVELISNNIIEVKLEDGKPIVYQTTHKERLLLNDNISMFSRSNVSYSRIRELINIEANVYEAVKNKYKKRPVKDFTDKPDLSSNIFKDGVREKHFYFPGLKQGVKTELIYKHRINRPQFLGRIFTSTHIPIVNKTITLKFPEEVEMGVIVKHLEDSDYELRKTLDKGINIWTFTLKDIKSDKYEDDTPAFSLYLPHFIFHIKSYDYKNKKHTVLSNLDDYVKWYYSISKGVNETHNSLLKAFTDTLLEGIESDLEKAKKIYYWTQDNIRYLAVEDGMNGFIPQQGAEVFEQRHGDCKGMSSFMHAVGKAAGLNIHLALVGTRSIGYDIEEVFLPLSYNHMIAVYQENGKSYIMDATVDYSEFGVPTQYIHGKKVLVLQDAGKYEVLHLPVTSNQYSQIIRNAEIYLKNDTLFGSGEYYLKGYDRERFLNYYNHFNSKDKKEMMRETLELGNDKFKADSIISAGLKGKDKDVQIHFQYTLPDYVKSFEDEKYLNLHLQKVLQSDVVDIKNRKHAVDFDYNQHLSSTVQFYIPEGYELNYVPEKAEYENKKFSFKILYTVENDRIVMQKEINFYSPILEVEDFEYFNLFIRKLTKAQNTSIVLKRKHPKQ